MSSPWPITLADARAAQARLRPHLQTTPLRRYATLDHSVGHDIGVFVKHENHHPTNSFKARNAVSAATLISERAPGRGLIAASRGNHGQGLAWAGQRLKMPVTICVPEGNSPDKNRAIQGFGAALVVQGRDYDESVQVSMQLAEHHKLELVHSTNNRGVIAGAATMGLEVLEEQNPEIDAFVISVGGGSQAVGVMTVVRELAPKVEVYGVQAAGASAIHDGWHAQKPVFKTAADTFADGLATRGCYELTFDALRTGLTDFVTVTDQEIAHAIGLMLETTHNLAEGAGAAGVAGLVKLAPRLAGKKVCVILSGGNIDAGVLRRVLDFDV